MEISGYDSNGDVIKKVKSIQYYVNLGSNSYSSSSDYSNAPYENSDPFFYIVGFADSESGLPW